MIIEDNKSFYLIIFVLSGLIKYNLTIRSNCLLVKASTMFLPKFITSSVIKPTLTTNIEMTKAKILIEDNQKIVYVKIFTFSLDTPFKTLDLREIYGL